MVADVLDEVEVASGETDDFVHEGIGFHSFLFEIVEFVAMVDEEGHEIERVFEVGGVILISHLMATIILGGDDGLILHHEVQKLLHHHLFLAISSHEPAVSHKMTPYIEIFLETRPMFRHFFMHHFSVFLQKSNHVLTLLFVFR